MGPPPFPTVDRHTTGNITTTSLVGGNLTVLSMVPTVVVQSAFLFSRTYSLFVWDAQRCQPNLEIQCQGVVDAVQSLVR